MTNRVQRAFYLAEETVEDTEILSPINIFLGLILENTGVLFILNKYYNQFIDELYASILKQKTPNSSYSNIYFKHRISDTAMESLNASIDIMNGENQIYLSEKHIIRGLFAHKNELFDFFSSNDIDNILNLTTTSKNLIVDLTDLHLNINLDPLITARRIKKTEEYLLYDFIGKEFNYSWSDTVLSLFNSDKIPIFISLYKNDIVGFASYDTMGFNLFGPMGVMKSYRNMHIGYLLLYKCLYEIKKRGASYCIIKEAGPIEFYEKCCNAKIIY